MKTISRRRFLQITGTAIGLTACQTINLNSAKKAKVVVIGGGFAGVSVARSIRCLDNAISVSLIEPKLNYITCPGSNWLFAGITDLNKLTQNYHALQTEYGVNLLSEQVVKVDPVSQQLSLANGLTLDYDRLIMAAGISFDWDSIPGYSAQSAEIFPHAWQAGPQTLLLQKQMQALSDGGSILIYSPAEPYRCPPGPYERASMMACWLKRFKPKSKILILDAKRSFSKQKLFEAGWKEHFGYASQNSLIEWHSIADNPVLELDSKTKTLRTDFGDKFKADVLNIIPPQKAARILLETGLTDATGWCPVDPKTCQSVFQEKIHVIGDAANYAPLPKSAFAAISEAKVCAKAVVSLINQQPVAEPIWFNTCYSLLTAEHGISVAGVYKLNAEQKIELVAGSGGVSRLNDTNAAKQEAAYAKTIYNSLVFDSFGQRNSLFNG